MARVLKKPFEFARYEGIPVMVTVKDVKNINLLVKPYSIDISVPPYVSRKELKEVYHKWDGTIAKYLAKYRARSRFRDHEFLMYMDHKCYFYTFADVDRPSAEYTKYEVLVTFPTSYSDYSIDKLKEYVRVHKDEFDTKAQAKAANVDAGILKRVHLYGKDYPVEYSKDYNHIFRTQDKLIFPAELKNRGNQLKYLDEYLTDELNFNVEDLLEKWEPIFDKKVRGVQIKRYKSKWASLKPYTGELRVNFFLICAPRECIESTIVHELCHFEHGGHQADFYDELLYYMPNYHQVDGLLKNYHLPYDYYEFE